MTLDAVMRAPSTNVPEVVVLDSMHEDKGRKEILSPQEDLVSDLHIPGFFGLFKWGNTSRQSAKANGTYP